MHTIGRFAFAKCDNLHFVELGEGVDTIGYAAFLECGNLQYINYPSTLKVIDTSAFQYDSTLRSDLVLSEGFTTMGVTAFGDNAMSTVSLPGTMTAVPKQVFWGCTNLSDVTLGEGIATIRESAFVNCPSLHKLTLPASLDSIAPYALAGSTQIDILVFRGSVPPATTVDDSILNDYHTILYVPYGSMAAYRAHPYWGLFMNIVEVFPYTHQGTTLYYLVDADGNASVVPPLYPFSTNDDTEGNAWEGYTKPVGAVTVPDSVPFGGTMHAVTAVADYALFNCREVTGVTLPPTVASLGRNAFAQCRAMQSVNIPDGVTRLPYGCFQVCLALQTIDIPASVSRINQGAFYNCRGLQEVSFHQGLDSIDWLAFYYCSALESITLPEGLRYIGYEAFMRDTNLRHIDLPSTLEKVDGNVFREDVHLDSVIFPDGLTNLGGGVLNDCRSLTYVHLPENIESLNVLLLSGTNLETFVVPPHVHTIGSWVFSDCPRLHKVTLPASVTTIQNDVFDNTPLDTLILECAVPPALIQEEGYPTFQEYTATLIVPCGAAAAYRADTLWSRFPDIIENCTAIDEPDAFDGINIHTANGRIVVEGTIDEVQVFDITGRLTQTFKQSSNQSLPSGVYLVRIGNRPAQKVVVIK